MNWLSKYVALLKRSGSFNISAARKLSPLTFKNAHTRKKEISTRFGFKTKGVIHRKLSVDERVNLNTLVNYTC